MSNIIEKILNDADGDHMEDGGHMMDGWWGWWGPTMWLWWILFWLVFVVIGILVYKDAEKRNMNGLLWFILVIIPWLGILFLILYLVVREDRSQPLSTHRSAKAIIDERYAMGEITREDYIRLKDDLKVGSSNHEKQKR
jgi:putative membrane protein